MTISEKNKDLILKYWNSWQKPDWEEMRSCLANEINFGGHPMNADQFTVMCQNGNPWKDVSLLASHFTDAGGAILYEGTDTVTEKTIRVGEFITVEDDKIVASVASFGSGQPPQ